MKQRRRRAFGVGAAAAVLALTAGACAAPGTPGAGPNGPGGSPGPHASPDDTHGTPAAQLGYVRHANAVQWPAAGDYVPPGEGLQMLLPDGSCALGIGTYANGYRDVPTNWQRAAGATDCTSLRLTPAPGSGDPAVGSDQPPARSGGRNGGGVFGQAVLRWTDGSLVAVTDRITRLRLGGAEKQLATLDLPVPENPNSESEDQGRVHAVARSGNRLLIAGELFLNRVEHPALWSSDDVGATVHRIELPTPSGVFTASPILGLGTAGHEVVAVGATASNYADRRPDGTLPVWHSADGGTHWTLATVQGIPPSATVIGVIHAQGRWIAYGGVYGVGAPDQPIVLTSPDARHWQLADARLLGRGDVVAATVDGGGRPVLVGSEPIPQGVGKRPRYCGVLWLPDGAGWRRGSLGCGAEPPTAATTLADGRVLIAGNRDLWLGR
ncbi:beta propeller repeat protein [Streptacidiphilus rugosus]|uniref:hypothetical protein n=1 Tax=Streptacidiphilus rugosus TaxID=405783 RepID=UPI000567DA30|nr:hypothetical protein [Streptacidiphilus rugosus]